MKTQTQFDMVDWKRHPFLDGLSEPCLDILADCAMPTKFEAGELLFREGESANRFYLIYEGCVEIEVEEQDRAPAKVQEVHDGGVLGWSWLFPPYEWHFTARAVAPTKAMFFYGTRIREFCEENHDIGYELMKRTTLVMIQRLQATQRQLAKVSAHS